MKSNVSLYELQQLIKNAVYIGTPDIYWVVAEVSEIKINSFSGHCYLELIEKEKTGEGVKAKIRATIWRNNYLLISSRFENSTGSPIANGTKILFKARVEYHELYGISLSITDIDPSFTLGDMEARRMAIINQLNEEGVFNMNKELEFPVLPQRIAVISSKNAAGYTDFINHLNGNNEGYSFKTTLFETIMQGEQTEESLLISLNKIGETLNEFDLVAIIRGGGSKSDLVWFDNYNIAFYITQFPLPVVTGIGHDKDISVTDMVAFQSFKTPTAVADYLIESFMEIEENLILFGSSIKEIANKQINEAKQSLNEAIFELSSSSTNITGIYRNRLFSLQNNLVSKSMGTLSKFLTTVETMRNQIDKSAAYILKRWSEVLDLKLASTKETTNTYLRNRQIDIRILTEGLNNMDPENVLKRGYTLSYRDGVIIKDVTNLSINDIINTKFRDGNITSEIKKIDKTKNKL
jgi:exodeoxyribonuclease VII large subunit